VSYTKRRKINVVTIEQVKDMTDEQIMINLRKVAANLGAGTVQETEEAAMYFIVMSQRNGKDPKPKIKSMGYGVYDKAEKEGWF
jgi:hypothetical protein